MSFAFCENRQRGRTEMEYTDEELTLIAKEHGVSVDDLIFLRPELFASARNVSSPTPATVESDFKIPRLGKRKKEKKYRTMATEGVIAADVTTFHDNTDAPFAEFVRDLSKHLLRPANEVGVATMPPVPFDNRWENVVQAKISIDTPGRPAWTAVAPISRRTRVDNQTETPNADVRPGSQLTVYELMENGPDENMFFSRQKSTKAKRPSQKPFRISAVGLPATMTAVLPANFTSTLKRAVVLFPIGRNMSAGSTLNLDVLKTSDGILGLSFIDMKLTRVAILMFGKSDYVTARPTASQYQQNRNTLLVRSEAGQAVATGVEKATMIDPYMAEGEDKEMMVDMDGEGSDESHTSDDESAVVGEREEEEAMAMEENKGEEAQQMEREKKTQITGRPATFADYILGLVPSETRNAWRVGFAFPMARLLGVLRNSPVAQSLPTLSSVQYKAREMLLFSEGIRRSFDDLKGKVQLTKNQALSLSVTFALLAKLIRLALHDFIVGPRNAGVIPLDAVAFFPAVAFKDPAPMSVLYTAEGRAKLKSYKNDLYPTVEYLLEALSEMKDDISPSWLSGPAPIVCALLAQRELMAGSVMPIHVPLDQWPRRYASVVFFLEACTVQFAELGDLPAERIESVLDGIANSELEPARLFDIQMAFGDTPTEA